jgi:hypothetical protein
MANKIKRTISIAPESDYEIHRLAKLWGLPVAQARELCYHYAGARMGNPTDPALFIDTAKLRKAEAKVEMLKSAKIT